MKLFAAALLLGAVSAVSGKTSNLRSSRNLQQDEVVYGTYLEVDIQYADHSDGHLDAIALPDGTILDIEDDDDADNDVKNRGRGWFRKHGYNSGDTEIALTGRVVGSKIKLKMLPQDKSKDGKTLNQGNSNGYGLAKGKNKRGLEEDRRRLTTGTKTVLALRVVAPDSSTTSDEATISDEIFGTSGDAINLSSQYAVCSYDQLIFEPFNGATSTGEQITNGVATVEITENVNGADDGTIRNAITNAGNSKFGNMQSQFDYVMQCLPPGTNGSWIAYAYVNSWLSVYNDNWCNYPSGQMHEIGHNLGLAHSGESQTYDDQSGMMGYSYSNDEGPVMCFNAAKNYQLGWFDDKFTQMTLSDTFNGKLIGQADYTNSNLVGDEQVGIRITGAVEDYYVSFNRQVGHNSGTFEGGNQVLVHSRPTGTQYGESKLLAKLNAGGTYGINTAFSITVNSITTTTNPPGVATVTIGAFCSGGSSCCGNGVCDADENAFNCESDCACADDPDCQCVDDPEGWYDIDGPTFNCGWYASGSNCASHGDGYANNGITANMACCVCGGGTNTFVGPPPTPVPPTPVPPTPVPPTPVPPTPVPPTPVPPTPVPPTFVPPTPVPPTPVPPTSVPPTNPPPPPPPPPPPATCVDVTVEITTDNWGYETSWTISDSTSTTVMDGNSYGNSGTYTMTECLPKDSHYVITVYDTYGDGILYDGGYTVSAGGTVLAQGGGDFGHDEYKPFSVGNPAGSNPCAQCTDNPQGWYDSDGSYFNCGWYSSGSRCASYGDSYANLGTTANEACCSCGSGLSVCSTTAPAPASMFLASAEASAQNKPKNNKKKGTKQKAATDVPCPAKTLSKGSSCAADCECSSGKCKGNGICK